MTASVDFINGYINAGVKDENLDTNKISDGYHTFGELYEHRIILYIALCKTLDNKSLNHIWMSKNHSDGSSYDGWFLLGINATEGRQISYHLPMKYWDECKGFAVVKEKAVPFDGHTSNDVLERLKQL